MVHGFSLYMTTQTKPTHQELEEQADLILKEDRRTRKQSEDDDSSDMFGILLDHQLRYREEREVHSPNGLPLETDEPGIFSRPPSAATRRSIVNDE